MDYKDADTTVTHAEVQELLTALDKLLTHLERQGISNIDTDYAYELLESYEYFS